MSKHPSGRRSTSVLPPLQPSLDRIVPSTPRPATVPDLKIEAALYAALQEQRQMNAALRKAYWDLEAKFKKFRANRLAQGVGRNLKPAHLDRLARKGKGL